MNVREMYIYVYGKEKGANLKIPVMYYRYRAQELSYSELFLSLVQQKIG